MRFRTALRIARLDRAKYIYDALRAVILGRTKVQRGTKRAQTILTRQNPLPRVAPHTLRQRLLTRPARERRRVLRAMARQLSARTKQHRHVYPPWAKTQRRPEFSSDQASRWSEQHG